MSADANAGDVDTANVRAMTLHCRRCTHEIGEFLGPRAIRLGGAVIRQRIAYTCAVCRHKWRWRPATAEEVPETDQR